MNLPKKPANGALAKWIEENSSYRKRGCLRWPFSIHEATGYPGNTLWRGKQMFGHRAMCIAAHGNPPTSMHHAAHSCGNRWCINPKHLRWATVSENQMDRVKDGTSNRGTAHGMARLTEDDVRRIYSDNRPVTKIAEAFGINHRTVGCIKDGTSWGWLTGATK